ncbi:hypothetical protein SAMN05216350_110174 [Polaromonas sp. YR568]|nr:hypothetical protein SAMN05216350_110174 [Polaromonas sp. YR568]
MTRCLCVRLGSAIDLFSKIFNVEKQRTGIDKRRRSIFIAKTENCSTFGTKVHDQRCEVAIRRSDCERVGLIDIQQLQRINSHCNVRSILFLDEIKLLNWPNSVLVQLVCPTFETFLGPIAVSTTNMSYSQCGKFTQNSFNLCCRCIVSINKQRYLVFVLLGNFHTSLQGRFSPERNGLSSASPKA